MKRKIVLFSIISLLLISGCSKSYSFLDEYDTDIAVKLKYFSPFELEQDPKSLDDTSYDPGNSFHMIKDNKVVCTGNFISPHSYDELSMHLENQDMNIYDKGTKHNLEYTLYSLKGSNQYTYLIKIKDATSALVLENNISVDSAKDCLKNLKISSKQKSIKNS